jgi:predicted flap endonuclease-1-like 5' DNA nuclease
MRSDYALYIVAIIFFILTAITAFTLAEFERNLWVVTTAVLGLLFIGLGYTQKPKPQVITVEAPPQAPAPEMPMPSPVTEVMKEEKVETVVEVTPPKVELTEVKGIGEKRAQQLKALGITSVEDLAKASATDLAEKLKISPKITGRWVENAKNLAEKS